MKRHALSFVSTLSLVSVALAFGGCKLSLDGKDVTKSNDSSSNDGSGDSASDGSGNAASSGEGKYADSRRWKQAVKHRSKNHPAGTPWVELHVDSTPSNNATLLETTCDAAKENGICNGLDDDCDGYVDEECGVPKGAFQVSMTWETYNNMDLSIEYRSWDGFDSGFITHKKQNAYDKPKQEVGTSGGRTARLLKLGPDGKGSCACEGRKKVNGKILTCGPDCSEKRGMCVPDDANEFSEHAFLEGDEILPGHYDIKFYNNSRCGAPGSEVETAVTLTVSIGGKVVGTYKSGELQTQGFDFPIIDVYVP